jgi:hypothetical protein
MESAQLSLVNVQPFFVEERFRTSFEKSYGAARGNFNRKPSPNTERSPVLRSERTELDDSVRIFPI